MHQAEQIQARYRRFADVECAGYSDLYFHLAHAVADDEEIVALLAPLPVTQPNLFFASVQFVTGPDDMPRTASELHSFVDKNGEAVTQLMRSRHTQTNEVGRCAVLLPALPKAPLALLEVGASAGLCLLPDRYCYDYDGHELGDRSSPVRLTCRVMEKPPLPEQIPTIAWRGGMDLDPIDLQNADDVRWLLSCVFADHPERRARLMAAIEIARQERLVLRRGDLRTDLPALLAEVPRDLQLVVFHSAVLNYVDADDRVAFAETLRCASNQRDIIWISNEARSVVPEISAIAPARPQRQFLLGRTTFRNGERTDEFLGFAHPHGAELEWVGSCF